jgi:peptidoglycan/LPS O-acetylase OafA/YrhL
MDKEHIKELDVLRIIGFILVVAQHIFGSYAWREGAGFTESLILSLLYQIAQPAVPLFVMIVAISLFYNYSGRINVLNFYKKRFLNIFLPYAVWTVINIWESEQYSGVLYFFGQLAAGTGRYHLWYMSMVIRIYLCFPIILWVSKRILRTGKFFKVSFLVTFFVLYIILLKNNEVTEWFGRLVFGTPTFNEQKFLDRTPLMWSIYFVVGAYVILGYSHFRVWLQRFRKQIILAYIPLLLYNYFVEISPHLPGNIYVTAGYAYCFQKVLFMIISVFMFYIISSYISGQKPRLYRIFKETSAYSYPAYLAHVIVLQAVANNFNQLYPLKSYLLSGIIIYLITVVLTVKFMELLSILPFSEYFLGTKSKYPKWFGSRDLPAPATERFKITPS